MKMFDNRSNGCGCMFLFLAALIGLVYAGILANNIGIWIIIIFLFALVFCIFFAWAEM
jgi:hypothetical protein